ncbi:hypothetical protein MPH_00419 [Macrophomina phaseolina MS6]|uniref:Rhodopsin domain-containing protein n=1 Tax=Macrophomina phaseolina (strain MS6) TaxID=1126212 RepID=K2SZZ2_MACPH|nr:hypothetical protein MPH_00419 [Macrophomina phaseolina MS6]
MTKLGYGRHTRDIRPDYVPQIMKVNSIYERVWYPGVSLNKISVCIAYLRIFSHARANKWFCWALIVYSIGYCISIVTVQTANAALCPEATTPEKAWGQGKNMTFCIRRGRLVIAAAALNSFTDFVVFLWPARFLWDVQLPKEQRLGLIGLFCLGCLAGVVRIWYFFVWFKAEDKFWDGVWIFILPAIETNLAVVCGCLPACRPIIIRAFQPLIRWRENRAAARGPVQIIEEQSKEQEVRERQEREWWSTLERDTTLKEDEFAITMRTIHENDDRHGDEETGAMSTWPQISTTSTLNSEEIFQTNRARND